MLTRRSFIAGAALGAAAMLSPAAFAASATDKDPSAWIVELMNDTLNDIRKDPALVKADPTKVHTFVNNRIMPVVDFAKMTRTAVGPQWRQATASQRQQLQDGFRSLLTRVYSGAFSSVKDYKAELVPSRAAASSTPIIQTRMVSKSDKPVSVEYRMQREGNTWKIIDVNVGGVWMVQNYHSQFAGVLANGGIPALFRSMNDKTSSLNQKAKK